MKILNLITSKIISDIKDLKDKRYRLIGEYRIDTWIFRCIMILIISSLAYIAIHNNFDMDSFSCNGGKFIYNSYCENPFYREGYWKNFEYLPAGEYGLTTFNINKILILWGSFIILGFCSNHIWHNMFKRKKKVGKEERKDTLPFSTEDHINQLEKEAKFK